MNLNPFQKIYDRDTNSLFLGLNLESESYYQSSNQDFGSTNLSVVGISVPI